MKGMLTNWKTTVAGLIALIATAGPQIATLLDTDDLTNPDWQIVAAAVGVFLGLLTARDADKTSERSGAK